LLIKTKVKVRDKSIDSLRGLAVFIMIFASASPIIFVENHSFWIRALSSFAAPIFIFLVGFTLSKNQAEVAHNVSNKHLVFRSILSLFFAIVIDLFIKNTAPFVGYDILYLISFLLIIAVFLKKSSPTILLISATFILAISFIFQFYFDYSNALTILPKEDFSISEIGLHLENFIHKGRFPIFPWLAFFILGLFGGKIKARFGRLKIIFNLLFLFVFSVSLFYIFHQNKLIREGYVELYYPADLAFQINSISFLLLIWLNISFFKSKLFYPMQILGKVSFLIYAVHLAFISYFLSFIFELNEKSIVGTLFIFYASIFALAFLIEYIKKNSNWKKLPYLVRFIFGS
jgi:uncharacterized membrane protein